MCIFHGKRKPSLNSYFKMVPNAVEGLLYSDAHCINIWSKSVGFHYYVLRSNSWDEIGPQGWQDLIVCLLRGYKNS